MQVLCPQCGAPAAALTESRFYRCSFCASSFVVQAGQGLVEYTFDHVRDDRQAWSALTSYLEMRHCTEPLERVAVDYLFFPFWMVTRNGDRRRLLPAMEHSFPGIDLVTLPAGDLIFLGDTEDYPEPSITMAQAQESMPGDEGAGKWGMVFLPLYFLRYRTADQDYTAIVSGPDGRVFVVGHPLPTGSKVPLAHVAMIVCFILTLVLEGFLIRSHLVRAGVFLLSFALFYASYSALLKKELAT